MRSYLIFIIGLPCSGKSTVARTIAKHYGFIHIATEDVRAEYLSKKSVNNEDCDFTPEQHVKVYGEVEYRARKHIAAGDSVIVDGVYRNNQQRASIIKIVNDFKENVQPLYIWLTCEEGEAFRRLIERKKHGTNAPAGVNGYKKIKSEFLEPDNNFVRYDTTCGSDVVLCELIKEISR